MADISTYLAAIQNATYGEEVRGSIHDAIQIINAVGEVVLSTGTAIDSESSSVTGFYKDSLYLNTDTYILWKCTGTAWVSLGTLKGEKGDDGEDGTDGNRWLRGTAVSGKSSAATQFAVGDVIVNDNYINTTENAVYHCSQATDTEGNSLWVYDFTMAGGSGGASTWGDLTNKPFSTVGSEFSTDGDELALASAITEKIPQSSPSASIEGYVATVQSDGSVDWAEVETSDNVWKGTSDDWTNDTGNIPKADLSEGDEVIITDDESSNVLTNMESCIESTTASDIAGASALVDANTYSTSEKKIGKWVDGKPIYRKVVNYDATNLVLSTITYVSASDYGIENVDVPISTTGFLHNGGTVYCILNAPFYFDSAVHIARANLAPGGNFLLQADSRSWMVGSGVIWTMVVEYTKTTDTADSTD